MRGIRGLSQASLAAISEKWTFRSCRQGAVPSPGQPDDTAFRAVAKRPGFHLRVDVSGARWFFKVTSINNRDIYEKLQDENQVCAEGSQNLSDGTISPADFARFLTPAAWAEIGSSRPFPVFAD